MHVSQETPEQTDARLRRVLHTAEVELLPGAWRFDEFSADAFPRAVRRDAVALARDGRVWSQLVPARPDDPTGERISVWSIHFPDGVDNSGFVGWLASRIKEATGSGVVVICGQNGARGGIYDYWGCPAGVIDDVRAVLRALGARLPASAGAEGAQR